MWRPPGCDESFAQVVLGLNALVAGKAQHVAGFELLSQLQGSGLDAPLHDEQTRHMQVSFSTGAQPFVGGLFVGAATGFGITNVTLPPVPEPQIYLLMLAGLGALGAAVRRQRRGWLNAVWPCGASTRRAAAEGVRVGPSPIRHDITFPPSTFKVCAVM